MKTICLVMIVKNESAVIRRCLESVTSLINYWVICDTGSTDGTKEIVTDALEGVPGVLHEVPWVDFGHNRTLALHRAKGRGDYHLVLDADMTANVTAEFRDKLDADSYWIRIQDALDYHLPLLVSDRHDWSYVGVTHEFIHSGTARSRKKLPELCVTHFTDGGCRADKFKRDIQLLKRELESEPENPRNVFYLAQSYRDTGNLAQAIEWYEKRISLGGWEEEVWYSLYQVARSQQQLEIAWPLVQSAYLDAYQFRPSRLEPLVHVARFYRENGQFHLGWLFSRVVVETPYPDDILFIEKSVYDYELLLEYALCCEPLGKIEEATRVGERVMACRTAPEHALDMARSLHSRAQGRV